MVVKRGEIRVVDFEPSRGSEAAKRGPAIVISNDAANTTATRLGRGVVTVVPLTSNTEKVFAFQVLVPSGSSGLKCDSKAQAEQLRAVDVTTVGERVGMTPPDVLRSLEAAIRLHLAL